MTGADFEPWLSRWGLSLDGAGFTTAWGSRLAPVRRGGQAAMLKIAPSREERLGARLMAWWDGDGAARVLAIDDRAVLLERAMGERSLAAMARGDEDDAATSVLCMTVARLHAPRPAPPPSSLIPLARWFAALEPGAARRGGVMAHAAHVARTLLAAPEDCRPLHGDVHHDNVLDGGARGWLAIDPKGLIGDRGYDYANLICNPDIETVCVEGRFDRRIGLVARASGLERDRLLRWVLAYCGLSAAWTLDSGGDAAPALTIARMAAARLELRP